MRNFCFAALSSLVVASCVRAAAEDSVVINSSKPLQTMTGWEATARLWELGKEGDRYDPGWLRYRDAIISALVDDIGVNRIRIGLQSGFENPTDHWRAFIAGEIGYEELKSTFYEKINDDGDPHTARAGRFQFSALDYYVENLVLPMKARLEARGERLVVNLCYGDFKWSERQGTLSHARKPEEFAEFVDAAFLHLQEKHGLVPDIFEIVLEPDNTLDWDGEAMAKGLVAVDQRLSARGMRPRYVAPSTAHAGRAARYFDDMARNDRALSRLSAIAYHRYDGKKANAALPGIVERAKRHGLSTEMLEHVRGGVDELFADLTIGKVSAWQKYGVADEAGDGADGAAKAKPGYYLVKRGSRILPNGQSAALAQVFRNARLGAVRLEASSSRPEVAALAFRNPDGSHAVILKSTTGGRIVVSGAPRGAYAASAAGKRGERRDLAPISTDDDGRLVVDAPTMSVVALRQIIRN